MAISKEDFINMPGWHKALILVGFIFLIGLLWYFLLYSSSSDRISVLRDEIAKIERDIEIQLKAKKTKQTLAIQIRKLQEELTILRSKLPEEKEIPMLLSRVNEIGRLNGLEFDRFAPEKPVRKDYYSEIPVMIEVKGGFHQVAFFLYRVGTMDRILHISNLKMGGFDANRGGNLKASMQATTYKYEATPIPEGKTKKQRSTSTRR